MNKAHHGRKARGVVTSAGELKLARAYFRCVKCGEGGYAADDRLGIDGRYSVEVQRMASLAAASWSYDISSQRLEELCGLRISENTIREIAQRHAAAMNAWQHSDPEACRPFREATGEMEFTTDGTSVNTTGGWREMKLGIFSKRKRGEAATPQQWSDRTLPAPESRVSFAAIERSDRFGRRWKQWARRLGILDTSNVTVLADGAKWIWEEQLNHLRGAEGVLDIFHALEHVSDTAKKLYGERTPAATAWTDATRSLLLAGGWNAISQHIATTKARFRSRSKRSALESLQTYLAPHACHLNYAQRLAEGRSIGSGQVEGACKNLIGRRLKQTGARWKVRRVNRMAGLCSLMYNDNWKRYWSNLAT